MRDTMLPGRGGFNSSQVERHLENNTTPVQVSPFKASLNYSNWRDDGGNGLYTPVSSDGTTAIGPSAMFGGGSRPSNVISSVGGTDGSSGGSGGYGGGYSGYSYSSGPIGYNLDLSAFQKSRDAIIAGANNAKNMLKNQYDRLLAELDKKTKEGNEQFGRGRATISEDAYDRSRENLNSLAARGLAGSGLQQLGEVQERMETGQQMNDLASQYYAYLDDIDTQRKEGEAQYNEGIQSIEDSLQQQLANIGLQEFQAQDDYNRYMSNLAMQLAEAQAYNAGSSIVSGKSANEIEQLRDIFDKQSQAYWDRFQNGWDPAEYNDAMSKLLQNAIEQDPDGNYQVTWAPSYTEEELLAMSQGNSAQSTNSNNARYGFTKNPAYQAALNGLMSGLTYGTYQPYK